MWADQVSELPIEEEVAETDLLTVVFDPRRCAQRWFVLEELGFDHHTALTLALEGEPGLTDGERDELARLTLGLE
jgi:hypothetical protein